MIVKFNVRFNDAPALNRLRTKREEAEHKVAEEVLKDTDRFVPARTRSLANRAHVVDNQVVYPGPYARFLYYGKLMVDPNTGSPFAPKGQRKVLTDRNLVFSRAVNPDAQSHWFEASKAQNLEKWVRLAAKEMDEDG